MALNLVATPIGHPDDVSLRALQKLQSVPVIILEERKECTRFLRHHGITSENKIYEQLNEHSTSEDLQYLLGLCTNQEVALITDCGTPGFADPGADLVKLCRAHNVPVHSLPGASSLMTLLSLTSERLSEFVFRGFLSAENDLRQAQWKSLQSEKRALVVMDTPYRMQKTASEVQAFFPNRKILWAADLTQETEFVVEAQGSQLLRALQKFPAKAEFMTLIYPASQKNN